MKLCSLTDYVAGGTDLLSIALYQRQAESCSNSAEALRAQRWATSSVESRHVSEHYL